MHKPEYLAQGEVSRLFPVLATSSKEGRATSVLLACISNVQELAKSLIVTADQNLPKRASLHTYTEVVFKNEKEHPKDRPDGLIVFYHGKKEWRALIETKVGNTDLDAGQIDRYRNIAKNQNIDCVITISNQFSRSPSEHPLEEVRKGRSKIHVYHWSWMYILTTVDLLLRNNDIEDRDHVFLLSELKRFLSHESTGVKGYTRMPPEWGELNKHVSAGGNISPKSDIAKTVLDAWHQEVRDLTLIMSRQTDVFVAEKISRNHVNNVEARIKDELCLLAEHNSLFAYLTIPNAASIIEITANIARRSVDVGMTLRAPEDKKTSKARINWLLRQVKTEETDHLFVRLNWPGRSPSTQFSFKELIDDPAIVEKGKETLQVLSFHIFAAVRLGVRFAQQANFIVDIEAIVPDFYRDIGQNLSEWRQSAPRIKSDKSDASDVSITALAIESDDGVED